eukprot:15780652-Heterocapsa_arctica.AAC.1
MGADAPRICYVHALNHWHASEIDPRSCTFDDNSAFLERQAPGAEADPEALDVMSMPVHTTNHGKGADLEGSPLISWSRDHQPSNHAVH